MRVAIALPTSAIVLKSGVKRRSSQITSIFRRASASRRRLERTRLRYPRSIKATDQSSDFVAHAREALSDPRASFAVADALDLPADDASIDVITAALVLNFVPDRTAGLKEMCRTLRPGGLLSFYVWDYPGGGMGFIDAFWKAAASRR